MDNNDNKRGFSGLSNLASDVGAIDEPIKHKPKTKPSTPKHPPQPQGKSASSESEQKTTSSPASRIACPDGNCVGAIRENGKCGICGKDKSWNESQEESQPLSTAGDPPKSGGARGKWILGIIGVVFVVWLIKNDGDQSNKKFEYNPPTSSQSDSRPQSHSLGTKQIREVQQLLADLGYDPGPIDGKYGRQTAKAVKEYQRKIYHPQTGEIEDVLIYLLKKERDKKALEISASTQ